MAHLWGPLEVGDGFPSRKVISCGSSFKQFCFFNFVFIFSKFRSVVGMSCLLGFLSHLVSTKLLPKPAFLSIAIENTSDFTPSNKKTNNHNKNN